MSRPIEIQFYFGIRSRCSYLAATQIERLERETDARVAWHCLASEALMVAAGYRPFAGKPTSGQYEWPYRRQDAEAWAEFYGVPFQEPAEPMADAHRSTFACIAAERMGAGAVYGRRLFSIYFAAGRDPLADAELTEEAATLGLDRQRFAALLADPETERFHRATVERARAAGAFGVPTFVVGDRLFWGNDRLPLLRHRIAQLQAQGRIQKSETRRLPNSDF